MNRLLSLALVLVLGWLLGGLGVALWDKVPPLLERVAWSPQVQWIAPEAAVYRFYARRTFYIADTVQAAWLRLSSDNDFKLYVNGQLLTHEISLLNNANNGLGANFSESFQRLNDSSTYSVANSTEILVASTRDWKLSGYVDLTPYLHPGKNAIGIEVQKGQTSPRFVLQGAVYPAREDPIDLGTGSSTWKVSTLSENRQQLQWFDVDFPDQTWSEANNLGPVQEPTYSRLSDQLFDRFLQGSWISGVENEGEVWLRGNWTVPPTRQRSFIRFAGNSHYSLLVNGLLLNWYEPSMSNRLHMYEVTNFLHTGTNTLAVRLSRPLDQDKSLLQTDPLSFFLDGWVEANRQVTNSIATDQNWQSLTQPIPGWDKGSGSGQPVLLLSPPSPQEFRRIFEGNAYLLNYPNYFLHQGRWRISGIGIAFILAWVLGRFWLSSSNRIWDSISSGAGLLLPGILFLVGIGLLKHRYAESEHSLLFYQTQSNTLILSGFIGCICLSLVWSWLRLQRQSYTQGAYADGSITSLPSQTRWFIIGIVATSGLGLASWEWLISYLPLLFLLYLGLAFTLLTIWFSRRMGWQPQTWYKVVQKVPPTWRERLILLVILTVALGLRLYKLYAIDLSFDEGVSLDATQGIFRTGAPEATSGIWYTRSPAYHYLLAGWLGLVGYSVTNARFLAMFFGMLTLWFAYAFARQVTGKVWIALIVTLILAIDPWEIMFSRAVRFYQLVQCLSLLSFWLFFKSFIEDKGKWYQHGFCIAFTLAILNQELALLLFPGFLLGFLFFYRPFRLSSDWSVMLGNVLTVVIALYSVAFFGLKCLTPWVSLSTTTDSITKLHLLNITDFFTGFFVSFGRMSTLYSFFFFLGFIYFLRKRDGKIIFLFTTIFINLIIVTLLVRQFGNRYVYPLYPVFILLSVYSAIRIMEDLGRRFESIVKSALPLRSISFCLLGVLLISNIDLGRTLGGYQEATFKRNTELLKYYREHQQPGDVLVSATPSVASVVLGKLDYFILPAYKTDVFAFDSVYWKEGRVVDRWTGAVAITNVDQMSNILETAKRVWIQQDDGKFEALETQDAEFASYLQTLGHPVLETFGSRLRLWQQEDGVLPHLPNQGKDLGSY